jgi:hypothetical protein
MKKFAFLTAGIAAALCFAACNSTEKQNTAAGAVGNKSACCSEAAKCDAKCTGDVKTCAKTDCCKKTDAKAAPGAVSDKKEGCASSCGTTKTSAKSDCSAAKSECTATKAECTATKSDCAKSCPMTGTTSSKDASMGAVSEKKDGCCKSSCTKTQG